MPAARRLDLAAPMREAALRMDPVRRQIQVGQVQIGAVAQLVERVVRNDEVWGSIPHSSTKSTLKHAVAVI